MAKNPEVPMKTVCQHRKHIEVSQKFYAFLRTLVIALTIHVRIMYICCCPVPLIKGYSQHYKIGTSFKMEPLREIILSGSNEYLCFETNNVEHDPVDFIFTWPFLS